MIKTLQKRFAIARNLKSAMLTRGFEPPTHGLQYRCSTS